MARTTLEKNSLLRYFEIFKAKFFKIVLLNIFFFTALSLVLIASFGLAYLMFNVLHLPALTLPLATLPLIALGPVIGAATKLCREFVREEPGFFWEDFKRAFRQNWKQSTLIALLQFLVIWVLVIALPFYYQNMVNATDTFMNVFNTIGTGVCIFAAFVVIVMSYYLYMMAVTLKLRLNELIKNAFIFTFLCFLKNVLLTLILAIWIGITAFLTLFMLSSANALVYGLMIAFFMIFFFGFIFYTTAFFSYPQIKRYVLDPYYEEHPSETAAGVGRKVSAQGIDYTAKAQSTEQSEYVYMNGRMIHRSALEQETVFSDESTDAEEK